MCSEAQKDLTRATVWSEIDWSSRNEGVGKEKEKKSPNDIISCCSVLVRLTGLSSAGCSNCLTQKEHIFLSYDCIFGDFMWHLGLRGISSQLFPSTDGTR